MPMAGMYCQSELDCALSLLRIVTTRMTGKRTRRRKRLELISNILCEGTYYESTKKQAEDK